MMEYKKLMVGFEVKDGRVCALGGHAAYEGKLPELAAMACDNGADELWVRDNSIGCLLYI